MGILAGGVVREINERVPPIAAARPGDLLTSGKRHACWWCSGLIRVRREEPLEREGDLLTKNKNKTKLFY